MIPIQLTLQGLYSYKEKQTIDFQPLIASGLFGLFGPIGSGKSTVLEAIMLALYNKTERLSSFRNYNIMNLQSNALFIDFIFCSGAGNKEKYRALYSSKRNSKDFSDVKIKERGYYKWEDDQWRPMEGLDNAAPILGMSYDNFMKTIIIPQGKFRDFVDQSTTARTQMLKELFPLEKFDLFSRTSKLLTQTKADIQTVERLLEELGELGKEDIEVLEQEIKTLQASQQEKTDTLVKLRKAEEKLRALEKLYKTYYEVAESLKQLKADEDLFKKREIQLDTYHKAYTYFKEKLATLHLLLQDAQKKKRHLENLNMQRKQAEETLKVNREKFLKAKDKLGEVEETKQKCEDLKIIIEVSKVIQTAKNCELEAKEALQNVTELKERMSGAQKSVLSYEAKIKAQEQDLQDIEPLMGTMHWLEQEARLQEENKDIARQIVVFSERNEAHQQSLKVLLQKQHIPEENVPANKGLEVIMKTRNEVQSSIDMLSQQLMQVKVKQQLAEYSSALEDGQPCPLCGAPHHPEPLQHTAVFEEISELEQQLQHLKDRDDQLITLAQEMRSIGTKITANEELIQNSKIALQKAEAKLKNHLTEKPETVAKYSGIEELKKVLMEKGLVKKELQKTKEQRDKLRKTLVDDEGRLEQKGNILQELLQKKAAEEAKINQLKQMLKVYDFKKFEGYTISELSASLDRGLKSILNLQQHFEETVQQVQRNEQTLSQLKGQLGAEEFSMEALIDKINQLDTDVQVLLKEKGFHSIAQVKTLLSMNLNMDWERQEIERYKNDLLKVEQQYLVLKQEIDNRNYSATYHQEMVLEIENLDEGVKVLRSQISLKQHEIEEVNRKMKRKKVLLKEQENLELRKQNLSELCNLFRGNGFMNYVSTLYLNNLCKSANARFLKLTKNNLSLELNEQNEFIVRDYLNNGKTRLLKTLSGGQTFQASLCLALALAENVKKLNKAEQSFFFLDEGFGALDKDSLSVVFDTLKTLRKENRAVGIISHVEELQQEVDVYLKIQNDREKGSQISYSWQ